VEGRNKSGHDDVIDSFVDEAPRNDRVVDRSVISYPAPSPAPRYFASSSANNFSTARRCAASSSDDSRSAW
jgi:hypothetical protein